MNSLDTCNTVRYIQVEFRSSSIMALLFIVFENVSSPGSELLLNFASDSSSEVLVVLTDFN